MYPQLPPLVINYSAMNNDLHHYVINKRTVGSYLWLESIEFHRSKIMFIINNNFIEHL